MSGCHVPLMNENQAIQAAAGCACPCHYPSWGGIHPPRCTCNCNRYLTPTPISVVMDNSMNKEILEKIEGRIKSIEDWRKGIKILCDQSKKPHKCPVCEGQGGTKISAVIDEECHACEGKGIIWG